MLDNIDNYLNNRTTNLRSTWLNVLSFPVLQIFPPRKAAVFKEGGGQLLGVVRTENAIPSRVESSLLQDNTTILQI